LASSNSVLIYDRFVQWNLEDSSSVSEATSTLCWYSTAAPGVKSGAKPDSTGTFWYVKTITFIPAVATATGGYAQLVDKDASGPVIFTAYFETAVDVYSQTYDPPLRCRPMWFTSLSVEFATGSKWVFELA
jgi:hypothetical protein